MDYSIFIKLVAFFAAFVVFIYLCKKIKEKMLFLQAKAFVPLLTRKMSRYIKTYAYEEKDFYALDKANSDIIDKRKQGMDYLQDCFQKNYPKSIELSERIKEGFSDLRFTDVNRVPFQFSKLINQKLNISSIMVKSEGPYLEDIDNNGSIDISGSYGCNVVGYDFYKSCIEKGWEKVKELGPLLGPLHPIVAENIEKLKSFSGLDEVSFHMSGTEAVMAAIRVARFNTKRNKIVCFSGAYHGWWDGVQASLGSERDIPDCLLLKDMHPKSLDLIISKRKEIAGILINPIQSFHPNASPPNDAMLVTSDLRSTEPVNHQYQTWLKQIREICSKYDIPLIFDEVYTGFRLAPGGAQEYFDVQADMVIYGKTVAGGLPIGVVCGKKQLMKRFDENHPLRIAYVVGTFSAHPHVMGAMNVFLSWAENPETKMIYQEKNQMFAQWAKETNNKLTSLHLPIQITYVGTVWTVLFSLCSRYNWMLQYYLRAEGLTLSWVGSGRCLVSFDFEEKHYQALQEKLIAAATRMKEDGWWWIDATNPLTDKQVKKSVLRETLISMISIPKPIKTFVSEIMQRKHDDHIASHSNLINQFLHLISSSIFVYAYFAIFVAPTQAVSLGLLALLIRQAGHALLEPPCHDKEKLLLGFTTKSKTILVTVFVLLPILLIIDTLFFKLTPIATQGFSQQLTVCGFYWLAVSAIAIGGNVISLVKKYGVRTSMIWFIKLITDPFTDIIAYYPSAYKIFLGVVR